MVQLCLGSVPGGKRRKCTKSFCRVHGCASLCTSCDLFRVVPAVFRTSPRGEPHADTTRAIIIRVGERRCPTVSILVRIYSSAFRQSSFRNRRQKEWNFPRRCTFLILKNIQVWIIHVIEFICCSGTKVHLLFFNLSLDFLNRESAYSSNGRWLSCRFFGSHVWVSRC